MSELDKPDFPDFEIGTSARPRTFSPDEMVTCEDCLRANPPTRASCLYCGAPLPGAVPAPTSEDLPVAIQTVPASGFYVVVSHDKIDQSSIEKLSSRVPVKPEDLRNAVNARATLPLMQFTSVAESQSFVDNLRGFGAEAEIIKADELQTSANPKKIRALEFSDSGLTGVTISSGERLSETWEGLGLIVTGRLQMNNVEDVVRRKRGGHKPLDHRELTNDESICDLHGRSTPVGWRIQAGSFDFSCLGAEKGMTTFENFRGLMNLLRARSSNVVVDDSYVGARALLTSLWPLETNTRTGGWRRSGAGKVDLSTVTSTDNETQFNNYSSLLRVMRMRDI